MKWKCNKHNIIYTDDEGCLKCQREFRCGDINKQAQENFDGIRKV